MSFGSGRTPKSPTLPTPIAETRTLTTQAQRTGQRERKRLFGRRGKAGTVVAGRRALQPITLQQRVLKQAFKQTFG